MEFNDVVAEKASLERDILYFIRDKIRDFKEKTGIAIEDLKLEMSPVDEEGSKHRKELTGFRAIITL